MKCIIFGFEVLSYRNSSNGFFFCMGSYIWGSFIVRLVLKIIMFGLKKNRYEFVIYKIIIKVYRIRFLNLIEF